MTTFGDDLRGVIGYHDNGLLHGQKFAQQTGREWTHVGYVGHFSVREAKGMSGSIVGVPEHHMNVAFPVELPNEDPVRQFTIEGNRLALGDGETARRVFERV